MKEGVFQIEDHNHQIIPIGRICSPQGFGNQNNSFIFFDLVKIIENLLSTKTLRYVGNRQQRISKTCIVEQISKEIHSRINEERCQCCITLDIKYKDALFAKDLNVSLIETAHYAEITVFNELYNLISLEFPYEEFSFFDFENPNSYFHSKTEFKF